MRVAISGFFRDASGYGQAARRLVRAMLTQPALEISPGALLEDGSPKLELPEDLDAFLRRPAVAAVDVHLITAAANTFPTLRLPEARRHVGWTCWETDTLHPSFIAGASEMDVLIVPAEMTRQQFAKHDVRAVAIPLPCDGPFGVELLAAPLLAPATYVFYAIGTWEERKNPYGLLVSYLTAFTAYDDVALVLKVPGGPGAGQFCQQEITRLLEVLNVPAPPALHLQVGRWTEAQMWALHARGDCFVSLTRGEGFCCPLLDALEAGNRVIVSDWGAQAELVDGLTEGVSLVPCRMTPVVQQYHYFDALQSWGDPDLLAARAAMVAAFQCGRHFKRDGEPEWACRYGLETVGAQLAEALKEVGG